VPPTVLHVSETMLGGVGAVIADLSRAQHAAGWRVAVAAPEAPGIDGVVAHRWEPGARPGPHLPRVLRELASIVRREQPDLVHLHSSMAGMCGRLVVRRRRPTLFQPHSWSFYAVTGPVRRAALSWERAAGRWADVILCVSEDEQRAGHALGVRPGRFEVIPNGVDLTRFPPGDRAAARARLGWGSEPTAVCVGRLHRQKGQHALLDAWPQVRAQVPTARLVLVGEGPDRAGLEARRPEATTFTGQTSAVGDWVAAADVVVQPSVWEGMSLSLLEAMATARSVVVTDVPGMRETVRPGCGAVVTPGRPSELAAAVAERLRDPERAAAEGRAGRTAVEQHHDLTVQREAVLRLCLEMTA
jgi:glycosyltransferase involved in cell wall biosynthesis